VNPSELHFSGVPWIRRYDTKISFSDNFRRVFVMLIQYHLLGSELMESISSS